MRQGLNATENRDAAAVEPVLASDLLSSLFLVAVGTVEVPNRQSVRLGDRLRALYQRLRQLLGVVGKLLDQQLALVKIAVDPAGIR